MFPAGFHYWSHSDPSFSPWISNMLIHLWWTINHPIPSRKIDDHIIVKLESPLFQSHFFYFSPMDFHPWIVRKIPGRSAGSGPWYGGTAASPALGHECRAAARRMGWVPLKDLGAKMKKNKASKSRKIWEYHISSGKLPVCYWKWPSRNSEFSH